VEEQTINFDVQKIDMQAELARRMTQSNLRTVQQAIDMQRVRSSRFRPPAHCSSCASTRMAFPSIRL
jgi:hypothetical protein